MWVWAIAYYISNIKLVEQILDYIDDNFDKFWKKIGN